MTNPIARPWNDREWPLRSMPPPAPPSGAPVSSTGPPSPPADVGVMTAHTTYTSSPDQSASNTAAPARPRTPSAAGYVTVPLTW